MKQQTFTKITFLLTSFFLIISTWTIGQTIIPFGDACANSTTIIEQLNTSSTFTDANSIYQSAGQSFVVPGSGTVEIIGVAMYLGSILADDFTMSLYSGTPGSSLPPPIASKTITNGADIFAGSGDIKATFLFDNPIMLNGGETYFFLLDPSYDPSLSSAARYSYRFHFGNFSSGGSALSGLSSGAVGQWNAGFQYDLKFSIISSCASADPCIAINALIDIIDGSGYSSSVESVLTRILLMAKDRYQRAAYIGAVNLLDRFKFLVGSNVPLADQMALKDAADLIITDINNGATVCN